MPRKRGTSLVLVASVVAVVVVISSCLMFADWEAIPYWCGTDSARLEYVERGVRDGKFIGWSKSRVEQVFGEGFHFGGDPEGPKWYSIYRWHGSPKYYLAVTYQADVVIKVELVKISS